MDGDEAGKKGTNAERKRGRKDRMNDGRIA
jgi:hypothetical protein